MIHATTPAPNGESSAYQSGAPSAQYTATQIVSEISVVTAAHHHANTAQANGGTIHSRAGSHMRFGATRRTNGIGGKASGTPVARFLVHPSTMPARLEYMRVTMYCSPCVRKMSRWCLT